MHGLLIIHKTLSNDFITLYDNCIWLVYYIDTYNSFLPFLRFLFQLLFWQTWFLDCGFSKKHVKVTLCSFSFERLLWFISITFIFLIPASTLYWLNPFWSTRNSINSFSLGYGFPFLNSIFSRSLTDGFLNISLAAAYLVIKALGILYFFFLLSLEFPS